MVHTIVELLIAKLVRPLEELQQTTPPPTGALVYGPKRSPMGVLVVALLVVALLVVALLVVAHLLLSVLAHRILQVARTLPTSTMPAGWPHHLSRQPQSHHRLC
jgi:hypothetical protein